MFCRDFVTSYGYCAYYSTSQSERVSNLYGWNDVGGVCNVKVVFSQCVGVGISVSQCDVDDLARVPCVACTCRIDYDSGRAVANGYCYLVVIFD